MNELTTDPTSQWRCIPFPPLTLRDKDMDGSLIDLLDRIPTMSATILGLDILLDEPSIDLRKAAELVLSDVGATIQVLRLIDRDYEVAADRPSRMVDCIAGLDVGAWFEAVSARTFVCDRGHSGLTAVWKHCRVIAECAQQIAESLDEVNPEYAYLVGLFHDLEAIPAGLGWPIGGAGTGVSKVTVAIEASLPPVVVAALRSVKDPFTASPWKFILGAAHELAKSRIDFDEVLCATGAGERRMKRSSSPRMNSPRKAWMVPASSTELISSKHADFTQLNPLTSQTSANVAMYARADIGLPILLRATAAATVSAESE